MDQERVRSEFTRQAGPMAAAAAFRSPEILQRLSAALGAPPVGRVLDLACGPGIVAEAIAPLATELFGIDTTPAMVSAAERRLGAAGFAHARFQVARAEALPFGPAEFDAVITRLSFHHFPDLPAVLSEIRRVLRPGGRLVVADVLSSPDAGESALHNALERLRDPTHVRMLSESELVGALASAGFVPVAHERWTQEREFSDWARIVSDPARTEPLRQVMRVLAQAGFHAGVGLREEGDELRFTHAWLLVVARLVDVTRP
jgi:ubiquinone/menaquinone biosynthesis C-methylase UbiE